MPRTARDVRSRDRADDSAYAVTLTDTFSQGMHLMRKHDPQLKEDGFAMLEPIAADVLPQLIAAFEEESDHGLRCWLLELIGDARSESALPVFTKELASDDESIRHWARRGLEQLETKEAQTILWRDSQSQAR
jgi:hypothetical protein